MNEVTTLRNKYQDWEEWEEGGEEEHEDEGDELGKWYKDDTGYREAVGVGLEYSERVKRAAAPLSGPLHDRGDAVDAHDLVSAAKTAALVAVRRPWSPLLRPRRLRTTQRPMRSSACRHSRRVAT